MFRRHDLQQRRYQDCAGPRPHANLYLAVATMAHLPAAFGQFTRLEN